MTQKPRIFLVAGEASGDLLGASLMRALKEICPEAEFHGIGGQEMAAEGLKSLFPMQELSVMGVFEVLPSLGRILKRMNQTVRAVRDIAPDALVTIDSPDFCFRVVKKLKKKGDTTPCIHYVAPSVWAWRPGRAQKIAKFLDHLLALLPFEPPYFTPYKLATTFVGHPIVEKMEERGDGARFRKAHGLRPGQPILCLLPGSRMSELQRLLPVFGDVANDILKKRPATVIVIPTLPHLKKHIETFFTGKGINPLVIDNLAEKMDCFSASTAALAASGTVTLELALCDTPHVITYKLSPLSSLIARRVIRTPWVNLVNIILQRPAVPELLLEDCRAASILEALHPLLEGKAERTAQLTAFREALIALGLGDPETPGERAAKAVLSTISRDIIPPHTEEINEYPRAQGL